MKHALQYNFIALFIQGWITAYYSCIANTVLLNKLQASASTGVWGWGIYENGAGWRRKSFSFHWRLRNEAKEYTDISLEQPFSIWPFLGVLHFGAAPFTFSFPFFFFFYFIGREDGAQSLLARKFPPLWSYTAYQILSMPFGGFSIMSFFICLLQAFL